MATNGTTPGARRVGACLLAGLLLAGCATAPPQREGYAPAPAEPSRPEVSAAGTVLNALALPVTVAFKVVVCAGTIALGVPATAVLALSDPEGTGFQRQNLNEAFATNCGWPW